MYINIYITHIHTYFTGAYEGHSTEIAIFFTDKNRITLNFSDFRKITQILFKLHIMNSHS